MSYFELFFRERPQRLCGLFQAATVRVLGHGLHVFGQMNHEFGHHSGYVVPLVLVVADGLILERVHRCQLFFEGKDESVLYLPILGRLELFE